MRKEEIYRIMKPRANLSILSGWEVHNGDFIYRVYERFGYKNTRIKNTLILANKPG